MSVNDPNTKEILERHILEDLESSRQQLIATSGYLTCIQNNLHVTVSSLIAVAVVWMSELPTKLNPIILPLMASIKREQEEILQQKAAEALAELISRCVERKPSPNDKLIKNLCTIVCMDPCETPQAVTINSMEIVEYQDLLSFGRSFANGKTIVQSPASSEDRTKVEGFISRRGSELALKHLCEKFGSMLFDKLPRLWDYLTEVLKPEIHEGQISSDIQRTSLTVDSVKDPQILINNIQLGLSVLIQQTSLYQEIKNSFWLMLIFLFLQVRFYSCFGMLHIFQAFLMSNLKTKLR